MMKSPLLLIGNFLSSTLGVRGVSEDLAEELSRSGWTVITTSDRPGRIAKTIDMLATIRRRRGDYELAHIEVYSGNAFIWAELSGMLLGLLGKPFLLTLHGGNLPGFARRHPRRVRRLLRSASAVVTPSNYLLEEMAPWRSDLRRIPNPLHLDTYDYRPRAAVSPNLIWLRAFHGIYNPTLAPRVLSLISQDFPEARLIMIGPDKRDGSLEATIETARRLGVESRIEITGRVPKSEIPRHLNRGDIFLNTTDVDNTPVSVLEAMACGLCVVSTDAGGLRWLLNDGDDALLAPAGDAAALATAVKRLLLNHDLAESISRTGRRKVEALDWNSILPMWEKLLDETARRTTECSATHIF